MIYKVSKFSTIKLLGIISLYVLTHIKDHLIIHLLLNSRSTTIFIFQTMKLFTWLVAFITCLYLSIYVYTWVEAPRDAPLPRPLAYPVSIYLCVYLGRSPTGCPPTTSPSISCVCLCIVYRHRLPRI